MHQRSVAADDLRDGGLRVRGDQRDPVAVGVGRLADDHDAHRPCCEHRVPQASTAQFELAR
jgi:hypothetical protein